MSPGLISWIQVVKLLRHAEEEIDSNRIIPQTPISSHKYEQLKTLEQMLNQSHMTNGGQYRNRKVQAKSIRIF